jgi:hypothetical protein
VSDSATDSTNRFRDDCQRTAAARKQSSRCRYWFLAVAAPLRTYLVRPAEFGGKKSER